MKKLIIILFVLLGIQNIHAQTAAQEDTAIQYFDNDSKSIEIEYVAFANMLNDVEDLIDAIKEDPKHMVCDDPETKIISTRLSFTNEELDEQLRRLYLIKHALWDALYNDYIKHESTQ